MRVTGRQFDYRTHEVAVVSFAALVGMKHTAHVAENLEVPLSYRGLSAKERQALVADTLDRFQIVGKKDLYPTQLSGGQQQLVGVARAVIAKPALLLADEPTGNLHSAQADEIMQLFTIGLVQLNADGTPNFGQPVSTSTKFQWPSGEKVN